MRARLVTAPSAEPLSLTEAKAHLRVDHTDDDTYITWAITAARKSAEIFTRRSFITQTWDYFLDDFPRIYEHGTDIISILRGGCQSVTSVKYYDTDGAQQTLVAGTDYRAYPSAQEDELRIGLIEGKNWPAVENVRLDGVEIRAVMGYGNAATDVPNDLIWAVKMIVGDIYEHREQTVIGQAVNQIPNAAHNLLYPYQLSVMGGMS